MPEDPSTPTTAPTNQPEPATIVTPQVVTSESTTPSVPVVVTSQSVPSVSPVISGQANQPLAPQLSNNSQANKRRSKKLLGIPVLLIGLIVVLLLGGSAAAYFVVITPNKPENVWNSALKNTAAGYDKFIALSQKNKDVKGAKIAGTFKFDSGTVVADGSIDAKYYDKDGETKIDVGAAGVRVNLDVLSHVPDGATNPDLYAKVTGLDGIDKLMGSQSNDIGQAFGSFNNQWFVVDHTLLDQVEKSASSNTSSVPQLSAQEASNVEAAIGRVNRDYLLSTDPNKAVLSVQQKVGREKVDNRSSYHFKVGYNKDHLKTYATALKAELDKTKLKDTYTQEQFDGLTKSIDQLDGKGTADVWVDMGTKLIRKVRFTEDGKADNYVDLGLNYTGGDSYPFSIGFNSKDDSSSSNGTVNMTLNAKNNSLAIDANFKVTGGDKPVSGSLKATITQSNDKVPFTKPADAKSLTELFSGLGGGGVLGASTDQPSAGHQLPSFLTNVL